MYGKLIDGALHIAPKKLPGDGAIVYNTTTGGQSFTFEFDLELYVNGTRYI